VPDVIAGEHNTQPDGVALRLILASQSARRQELLLQVGLSPECCPVKADESAQSDEAPAHLVKRLAMLKAQTYLESARPEAARQCVILGADTVIDLDGRVLGKPCDEADCVNTLLSLSGRAHDVLSGVCVLAPRADEAICRVVTTKVHFGAISESQALAYWNCGEPLGKAGSYAIQGLGARFVAHLSGSYSNVVGLPLYETMQMLAQAGLSVNLSSNN
jgi:septum formation protein